MHLQNATIETKSSKTTEAAMSSIRKDAEDPKPPQQQQHQRNRNTNVSPQLAATMEDDPILILANTNTIRAGNGNTSNHPFHNQVSALTDSERSATPGSDTGSPFFQSRGGPVKIDKTHTFLLDHHQTSVAKNSGGSGASFDLLANHVGMTLPDLFVPYGGSSEPHSAKSAPSSQGLDSMDHSDAPSSPRPSLIRSGPGPCPPSPGRLSLQPCGSTFNLYPKSLIEGNDVTVEHLDNLPRLVRRYRAYFQSSNKVYIRHNQGTKIYKLLRYNWFHVFLRWKTRFSMTVLMSFWTIMILVFAGVYVAHDSIRPYKSCGLGGEGTPITLAGAFAFSLETCTTVGYTLPNGVNSFFEPGCSSLQIIIFFQMAWSMMFNAFLITFLYNRLGRSETRSTQVIFSNKALVSIVDGQVRFQFRLFDCDAKHPVVEAHVRMYCIMKHRPVPRPLRILQPDDELGAKLFLSFPTIVSHNIDMYSLLHPPTATFLMKPKGLVLRQVDGDTTSREDIICPICGESFGNFERWLTHVRYQKVIEAKDEYPIEGTHLSLELSEIEGSAGSEATRDLEELKSHFKQNVSEIICLVEGIDPMQSGTFQALQSYRAEDIGWDAYSHFSPCLSVEHTYLPQTVNRLFSVDLDRFQDIVPDNEAAAAAANAALEEAAVKLEEAGLSSTTKDGSVKGTRKRHRRIKTISNRTSDSLFATDKGMHDNNAKAAEVLAKGGIETV
jgi:hypothetical protein